MPAVERGAALLPLMRIGSWRHCAFDALRSRRAAMNVGSKWEIGKMGMGLSVLLALAVVAGIEQRSGRVSRRRRVDDDRA